MKKILTIWSRATQVLGEGARGEGKMKGEGGLSKDTSGSKDTLYSSHVHTSRRRLFTIIKSMRIIERVVLILHRGAANQHQEMKQSTIITPSPTGRIDDYRNTVREK